MLDSNTMLSTCRRAAAWLIAGGLALSPAVTAAPAPQDAAMQVETQQGYSTSRLNLRREPAPGAAVIVVLPAGRPLEILRREEPWLEVSTDGQTGWVHSDFVTIAEQLATAPAATTAQPEATHSSPGRYAAGYGVGPMDTLRIQVLGLPDYDIKTRVSGAGTLSVPLLGEVEVAGLSPTEVEAKLASLLVERELLRSPQVSVFVEEFVSHGISIQGAVSKPGIYQLVGRSTLLDLLAEAGGLAGERDERFAGSIFIVRDDPAKGQERIEIDGDQLLNRGDVALNVELRPGDIVMIPHQEIARVYVSGAVARPGPIEFQHSDGITALQAVTAAGGPTQRARLGKVEIVRQQEDGSETRISLDLKKVARGKLADLGLNKGDMVIVPEWYL